jgi:hypothetical protein
MRFTSRYLIATTACMLSCWASAHAAQPFTGPDLSGVYACKGDDAHEGKYTATATLALVPQQSVGQHGAYTFKLEVPGYGAYPGHAAAQGTQVAIYFANTDPATKDFGTGIATFKKNGKGLWTFSKYYYEPEFKGGNHGLEWCTQQVALTPAAAAKAVPAGNMVVGGMPAPKYLSIAQFKRCLATEAHATYQSLCMPAAQPEACPAASWAQLSALQGTDKVPDCKGPAQR